MENEIPNRVIYERVAKGDDCESTCVVTEMVGAYRDLPAQSLVTPGPAKGPTTVNPIAAMRSR